MSKSWRMLLGAIVIAGIVGCQGTARPRLVDPGPEKYKQARAQRYDPYPSNEFGPPLVGARPREYQNPPPEILHVQPRLTNPGGFPTPELPR